MTISEQMAEQVSKTLAYEAEAGAACGWRPCTGCFESEDGQPVGDYPFSDIFGCLVGGGCSECGGIGAVWEYYSGETMNAMVAEVTASPIDQFTEWVAQGPKLAKAAGLYVGIKIYDKEPTR